MKNLFDTDNQSSIPYLGYYRPTYMKVSSKDGVGDFKLEFIRKYRISIWTSFKDVLIDVMNNGRSRFIPLDEILSSRYDENALFRFKGGVYLGEKKFRNRIACHLYDRLIEVLETAEIRNEYTRELRYLKLLSY